jgi:parallel beta-helix repeat protein
LKCTATGIGLASITLLSFSDLGLTLEPPQQFPLAQVPLNSETKSQDNVLFVNPSIGDKTIGNGSEAAPFKTLTQALAVAQPNSVIALSPGTYSTSSGETFPLRLKQGVSIQGDPRTRGSNIIIQGGGTFLSPTFARQNITILGATQASLIGVTVTNSNPRGYGLWIESSNPVVSDNTFTGNSHDGISITGNSAPTIRSNYFYQNGANGMTIYGTSRPEVRENVFEKTGFGINIAQKAAPILIGNRITQNRAGIVTQAKAQPLLRGNVIEGNTEDGLVAIATSQPDLGTKTEPGGNIFRQNGRYDINASASKQVIPAFGNQLASDHSSGNVDLAGINLVATPAIPQLARNPQSVRTNNEEKKFPVVVQPKPAQLSQSAGIGPVMTTSPIVIPVPRPASTSQVPAKPSSPPQTLSLIQINSSRPSQSRDKTLTGNTQLPPASGSDTAIEIPIPPTPSQPLAPPPPQPGSIAQNLPVLQSAQIVEAELLPVPSGNIPIGNTRNLPKVPVRGARTTSGGGPPLPPTRATSLGLRYRVVVDAGTASKQALVRSLVPGAFRTFSSNGRVFMQVGAYKDRAEADEMLQFVNSKGLRGTMEQIQ